MDFTNTINLTVLLCSGTAITALDVTKLTNLTDLSCGGDGQGLFTSIDVSGMTNLNSLAVYGYNLTNLILGTLPNLSGITLAGTGLTTLDLTSCTNPLNQLQVFLYTNGSLTSVNLKNGNTLINFDATNNPVLSYICADDSNLPYIKSVLSTAVGNNSNININSYCSFTPGGVSYPITGVTRFDPSTGCGPTINNVKINITDGNPISGATFTNTLGDYNFNVAQSGASSVTITPYFDNPAIFAVTPPSATFTSITSAQTQDFCISAVGVNPDLEIILMPIGQARPGFDATYKLIYKNKGNQIIVSDFINLVYDDLRTHFISATPPIYSLPNNPLVWQYTNLLPLETRVITFTLNINTPTDPLYPVIGGDILTYTATIDPIATDITPPDNNFIFHQTVVNSYDPNDKTCLEGDVIEPSNIGEYLHYNINFENTGTADAINIVVKDVIDDTKFDISTLQLMDSSHPVSTKITGNVVEFIFEAINLPPTVSAPTLSHGNVMFKIKTLPTLITGAVVENTANIYFDFNFPITTNTASSTFATLNSASFVRDNTIRVYPNPTRNNINVSSKTDIKSIQIFDIQGRLLQIIIENKPSALLDISNKQNGVYFLKVTTSDGSSIEKIIKE
ncbi:T9SS type A sorting domain-containing protein [Flavobacterium psychrotolerans]|uniref:T9SS type A sorting domain-containing protein n=1 Tax=Flavobacterium psychrotolerans TaxID=2169410 RepID=UPI00105822E2|nr:T9SS type A sorting domain-containing protein [Flavobacterium psychrotolerans]